MDTYSKGQIVFSKRGRDKDNAFIVYDIEGEYLYLVDGHIRKLQKPKKKKIIHIQMTKFVNAEIREKLERKEYLNDADIRKALSEYQQKS